MNTKTGLPCDVDHGWCSCGEWHENPDSERSHRFGSKTAGITLWNSDRSHVPPEEIVDWFKANYIVGPNGKPERLPGGNLIEYLAELAP